MKIILNKCIGLGSISEWAKETLNRKNIWDYSFDNDPELIDLLEKYGSEKVSSKWANLKVVEIPDNCRYALDEGLHGFQHILYGFEGDTRYYVK